VNEKHVVHVFSTFGPGGSQHRTADVFAALPPNFRHTVMSIDNNWGARAIFRGAPPVQFLTMPKHGARVLRGELRRALVDLRPDLMITYNWGAMEAIQAVAFRRGAPILHAQDGFGPDEARAQLPRRLWARRVFLRFCEAAVVPSRNLERIAHEEWWLPRRRVLYIANGIDCNRYVGNDAAARARFRGAQGIPAKAFVVGMVAHLRREKNPTRLVRAFAAGAPAGGILVFVGEGPEKAEIEKVASELGVRERLRFAGHINDPIDAYKAFDVFALCSDTEQMPVSVLDAMGVETPILSTDVGDVRAMVAPANAEFVTPLRDEGAFAAALGKLASDAGLRARIGAANRAKCVSHYSLEQQNNAYRDLYERFARPKREIWRSEHFRG
jgi:glycosyltransferase involved in cell wall biosynthesis